MNFEKKLNQAVLLQSKKQFSDAIKIYHRLLSFQPDHAGILNNLGAIYFDQKNVAMARPLFEKAVARNSKHGTAYLNLGRCHLNEGHFAEAIDCFSNAITVEPKGNYTALMLRAEAYAKSGNISAALNDVHQAVSMNTSDLGQYHYLSQLFFDLHFINESIEIHRIVLQKKPDSGLAHSMLGEAYLRMNCPKDAILAYWKAKELGEINATVCGNLGKAYWMVHSDANAREEFQRAIQFDPSIAVLYTNLGAVCKNLGRFGEAEVNLQKAIELDPGYEMTYNNLGSLLRHKGRFDEANTYFLKALQLKPDFSGAFSNYVYNLNSLPDITPQEIYEAHRKIDALYGSHYPQGELHFKNIPDPDKVIKVGYISPDLGQHSVSYFFESLLIGHNRQQINVTCYADLFHSDTVTDRLKQMADDWRYINKLNDEQLCDLIQNDQIDILVDLTGHTARNRLAVFARKAAPVQVTYIGYPNTTGLPAMDYRITDAVADPPGDSDRFHSEKLLRLPHCFLCFHPHENTPEIKIDSDSSGKRAITFGSFNALTKITRQVIETWAAILKTVPESNLILKNKSFKDKEVVQQFKSQFLEAGIDPERLIWIAFTDSLEEHFNLYNRIDIALDTFPYNGTTTTCEALWMGVPVLTVTWDRHSGRVSKSILKQLGLDEWVAPSISAYIEKAHFFASDRNKLLWYKKNLRKIMQESILCDPIRFSQSIDRVYRDIWQKWCLQRKDQLWNKNQKYKVNMMNADELQRAVNSIPYWYHKIKLPFGIITPGWAPLSEELYRVPADLNGKRVLDIGSWDGYWAFEALKRGAREVVAIDDFSDYLGVLAKEHRHAWDSFDLCKNVLGYGDDCCQRFEMSVYDISEEKTGKFDIVFCFGVLYHLRHPLLALDKIASVCTDQIFLESAIGDDYSPYNGGFGHGYPNQMVMEFYPTNQYGSNETNWWVPSLKCMAWMAKSAGFVQVEAWKTMDKPNELKYCRGFLHGLKKT